MSQGLRVGLTYAQDCAMQVCERLRIDPAGIMGSIRRGCGSVGDIDLVAPLPAALVGAVDGGGDGCDVRLGRDDLCARIESLFERPRPEGFLPGGPVVAGALGRIEKGVAPGFKCCSLVARFGDLSIGVQIHRYVDGPRGNKGYVEILRTGPREFTMGLFSRWKSGHGMQQLTEASERGFLVDAVGRAVATPTEASVFEGCGMRWVPPERRGVTGVIGGSGAPGGISLSSSGAA